MTTPTPSLITHQTEDGQTLRLCLSDSQKQYLYYEEDTLKYQLTRFPIPWNTDLPGFNAESLFFMIRKARLGRQGLQEAIAQVREGKNFVVERALEVSQLKADYPEAFEPGVKPLDYLFNQLVSPYYHLVIYQEDPQSPIHITFIVKGLLAHWISSENWMVWYETMEIATNGHFPSDFPLSQWQWLQTLEVHQLVQSFLFSFEPEEIQDQTLNNLPPAPRDDQQRLSRFHDGVMDTLFCQLLLGYPMDTALWSALPMG